MWNTAKEIWKTLLITHQRNSQVKDNKIDLLVQQYEQFVISEDESIDSAFARFNIIIISLKALDEGYCSKNYVRKFLRALRHKWRAKVTAIEESKDLASLSLDELIGNLKNRSVKMFSLPEVKTKSNANGGKRRRRDRKCFRCGDPNHLIGECLKPPKDKNQRAFVGGSWSDSGEEDDEKVKNKTCLVAQASSEICLGVDLEPDEWIKDSECSKHMTGNRKLFSSYKAYNGGNVIFGSNLRGNIIGKEMLKKFGLEESKPMKTSISSDTKLTKDEECESDDSTKYRGMIVIMEYLVNISKRRTFWSLNKDILKITILTTNTPYPSRKIRRICVRTHQRPQRKQVQYAVSRKGNTPYPGKAIRRIQERQYAVSRKGNTPYPGKAIRCIQAIWE
ncbi:retrovirus-related pol polyprotein from transposon TNT 1-94 [Tanacetum coccineum]